MVVRMHCHHIMWQLAACFSMVVCCQARFLLAKLNPSATHQSDQGLTSEVIFTEDVSLEVGIAGISSVPCKWIETVANL